MHWRITLSGLGKRNSRTHQERNIIKRFLTLSKFILTLLHLILYFCDLTLIHILIVLGHFALRKLVLVYPTSRKYKIKRL